MTKRFATLDAMIREIITQTQARPDHVEVLVSITQLVNASGADPRVVVGSLVEAIVTTVTERVPPKQRAEIGSKTVRLLQDYLMERGAA